MTKQLASFLFLVTIAGNVHARVTGTAPTSADVWCSGPSGAEVCVDASGNVIPTTDNDADLGTSSLRFKDLYVAGTLTLAAGAIDTAKLATDSVTTVKLINSAVDTTKLAADAVTTAKILTAAVDTAKLATDSVTTAKLITSAVDTAKIASDAVTTAKILTAAVDTSKLASASVTAIKIANGVVDSTKLATVFFDIKTKAQFDASTPTTGQAALCSDCTIPYSVCIGTGPTLSGWKVSHSASVGCGTNN